MRTGSMGGGYLPHVDGLRAIAVLAVLLYHLDARWLPGGFTGVDIFFVISGFVVSASMARRPAEGVAAGLLGFYARRFRRIVPALVACLLATAVVSALFIPQSWLSETSEKTGRMAFVGLSNWVLATTGNDYFSPRAEFNPYMHTWSLGVEEQFYLAFPWLFLAWSRGRRGRLLSLGLFALATAASLAYAWLRSRVPGHEVQSFYLTTARFWQLGAGVLLYQLLAVYEGRGRGLPSWLRSALLVPALAALGYGLWRARPGHSPWFDGVWPVLGALALLALLHGHAQGWTARALSSRPAVAVGRISYSLYLWHWPLLVLLRWTVDLESMWVRAGYVVLAFALAAASYRWIEQPFRYRVVRDWRPARLVLVTLAGVLFCAGVQRLVIKAQPYLSLSTVSRHPLDWYAYGEGIKDDFPACRLKTQQRPLAGALVREFSRGDCASPPGNARQLYVLGDSHALAYNEMLQRFALIDGGQVHLYGLGGCALADLLQAGLPSNPGCDAFLGAARAEIEARIQPGDILFLPGLRVARMADQDRLFDREQALAWMHSKKAVRGRAGVVTLTIAQLRPLAERGVRIVLEAPTPVLQAPPYRCSDWFNRANPICERGMSTGRAFMEDYRRPALDDLRRIADGLPNTSVWDPLPLLCDADHCGPSRDGHPLFFDADHLSGYGNRLLLPAFQAHLARLEDDVR